MAITVGLRELRQHASDLVRRVEAGEDVTVTVAGRPSVRLVPASTRAWVGWAELEDVLSGREDPDWATDRALIEAELADPWDQT